MTKTAAIFALCAAVLLGLAVSQEAGSSNVAPPAAADPSLVSNQPVGESTIRALADTPKFGAAQGDMDRKIQFHPEGAQQESDEPDLVDPDTACYGCCVQCSSCSKHRTCNHCSTSTNKCYFDGGDRIFATMTSCATSACKCSDDPTCGTSIRPPSTDSSSTTKGKKGCFEFPEGWTCDEAGHANDQAHAFKTGPCIDILNITSGETLCLEEDHLVKVNGKWWLAREIKSDGVQFKVLRTRESERLSSCWFGGKFSGIVRSFEVATFPMLTPEPLSGTVPLWLIRFFNHMFGYY